jgi:hypothetical protein
MKLDWLRGRVFPILGLVAMCEVAGFGYLMTNFVQVQQVNSEVITRNEDTIASNARKIEETQDHTVCRDRAQKTLDKMAKDLHELLSKKHH